MTLSSAPRKRRCLGPASCNPRQRRGIQIPSRPRTSWPATSTATISKTCVAPPVGIGSAGTPSSRTKMIAKLFSSKTSARPPSVLSPSPSSQSESWSLRAGGPRPAALRRGAEHGRPVRWFPGRAAWPQTQGCWRYPALSQSSRVRSLSPAGRGVDASASPAIWPSSPVALSTPQLVAATSGDRRGGGSYRRGPSRQRAPEMGVDELHGHRALADRGRAALGRARADVAGREDARHARLEQVRRRARRRP